MNVLRNLYKNLDMHPAVLRGVMSLMGTFFTMATYIENVALVVFTALEEGAAESSYC